MKKVLIVACAALAAPLVFAQAKSFEGASVGANVVSTKTTLETTAVSIDGSTASLDLTAQYTFALAPQFVLGVGLNIGTGNNKAGTDALGNEYISKNRYALEFTPGYALSDSLLVYGKIASLSATVETTGISESATGVGYGLGVRGAIDKNLFWLVGYDANQYAEKTNATIGGAYKVKSNTFSLGVGYKF